MTRRRQVPDRSPVTETYLRAQKPDVPRPRAGLERLILDHAQITSDQLVLEASSCYPNAERIPLVPHPAVSHRCAFGVSLS